ncbi:MAG: hypothetical protein ACLUD2_12420 [Clostridium sp.]
MMVSDYRAQADDDGGAPDQWHFMCCRNKNMGAGDRAAEAAGQGYCFASVWRQLLVIGMYDGLTDREPVAFYLLGLTGAAHLNVHQASAMTKVQNLTSNRRGPDRTFLLNGTAYYGLGLCSRRCR